MNRSVKISRQVALWIAVWAVILGVVLAGLGYWEMGFIKEGIQAYQERVQDSPSASDIGPFLASAALKAALLTVAGIAVTALLLWLSLRSVIRRETAQDMRVSPVAPVTGEDDERRHPEPSIEEKEAQAHSDQRKALHLLALLQREGRLVDFLQETLGAYDDAQIGAAVRGIQESCQKSLNNYVGPRPVIDKEEGELITIDEGFDANRIRLTGNVSGQLPFKGILQHRGWQSSGLNLPTLSGAQEPTLIAPAEVEIQ